MGTSHGRSGAPVVGGRDLQVLREALGRVQATCDVSSRLENDPVGLVRGISGGEGRELGGLLAASLAFGNVKSLRTNIQEVFDRLGPSIVEAMDRPAQAFDQLAGTGHRMVRDVDIWRLLVGGRSMQRRHNGLGRRFAELLRLCGGLRDALAAWTEELRRESGLVRDGVRRGPSHILADPRKNSGCKRLLLYLRWMVRGDDGVDLGLWDEVSPATLLIPVDTHIHRLAVNLGWTRASGPCWRASEEITRILSLIDPDDPARFDFPLCHMAMKRRCPPAKDRDTCEDCPLVSVCMR